MAEVREGVLPRLVFQPGGALQEQLAHALREAVLSGELSAGRRLPSTRQLAGELGLSRNTVLYVYEQLESEGYLVARRGAGTFVAPDLRGGDPADPGAPERPQAAPMSDESPRLAARVARTAGSGPMSQAPADALWPFMVGIPDVGSFPWPLWSRLTARRARSCDPTLLTYGDPRGLLDLRVAIANHIRTARGVRCGPEQVLIVNGSQQALDLVARVLVDPGDPVWIEEPGYRGARSAFLAAGAKLVPIPLDEEGIHVDSDAARDVDPRVVFVTPSNQFPTGVTTSLARRLALLERARRADAWIVEDDYDSEFRHSGAPIPALQGLDESGRVLYVGTFSKTLAPALRVGYLVLPPSLTWTFVAARVIGDTHTASLTQAVLADFLKHGHHARHVARMRRRYRERRQFMEAGLRERLGPRARIWPARGGMHLVMGLDSDADDREIFQRLEQRSVQALPLSAFYLGPPQRRGLMLGYAAFDQETTGSALDVLVDELRST